jgi:hypothetical protein
VDDAESGVESGRGNGGEGIGMEGSVRLQLTVWEQLL